MMTVNELIATLEEIVTEAPGAGDDPIYIEGYISGSFVPIFCVADGPDFWRILGNPSGIELELESGTGKLPAIMTQGQLGQYLGIGDHHIQMLMKLEGCPYFKIGRENRFWAGEFGKWLVTRARPGANILEETP